MCVHNSMELFFPQPDLRFQEVGLHQVGSRGLREDEGRGPSQT